jgi:pyruvate ferredoxin oxidoreductase alpha subunit
LEEVSRVIVVEKALAVGMGGIVSADVRLALQRRQTAVHTVVAGLGGRSISKVSLMQMIRDARADRLSDPHFLDLNWTVINQELARRQDTRRAGPMAEQLLRAVNAIAVKVI